MKTTIFMFHCAVCFCTPVQPTVSFTVNLTLHLCPPVLLPCDRFKEHLNNHEPKEVLSTEEYEELRTFCRQSQKAERAEQAQEKDEERPPGEEEPATPEGTDSVSDIHLPHTNEKLSNTYGFTSEVKKR